jgi:holin-like protein
MLKSLTTLLLFQALGETASFVLRLPLPGPVIGLMLLLAYLLIRPTTIDGLRATALDFLRHLSLLFVPAGVGIMLHGARLQAEGWKLLLAVVVSTVLTLAVTAMVTRWALRKFAQDNVATDTAP